VPIEEFFITWEKCQILVPAPMEQG
jgi:hypothetical protein